MHTSGSAQPAVREGDHRWAVRVLGPLEVRGGRGPIRLGGPQQRLVLALLVAGRGRPRTTEQLIAEVWPDDPPERARKTIQVHVSNLRRQLGGLDGVLGSAPNGYRLAIDRLTIDATDFERVLADTSSTDGGDPASTAARCRQALGMWVGSPYADIPEAEPIRAEQVRLSELRLVALERRIEAELALGQHRDLMGEIEGLTIEHPYRERFVALLMLAQYRSGRQADALRTLRRARAILDEQLGIEPGAELRELERRILNQDATLESASVRRSTLVAVEPEVDPAGRDLVRSIRGYELRDRLAAGEHVVVHHAYQAGAGREVAVTVIGTELSNTAEFVRRFEPEAQRIAELEHPHIASLLDYWRDPDGAYLVTRWLRGGRLVDALARGAVTAADAVRMVEQIGDALRHAHHKGVVHGAVSAAAVLLDGDGNAYLSDFAIALGATVTSDGHAASSADGVEPSMTGDVVGLAALARQLLTGRPSDDSPAADDGLAPELQAVLMSAGADGLGRPDDLVRAVKRAVGLDGAGTTSAPSRPVADVRNPYKGLRAFGRTDADDFHGRDALIARLEHAATAQRLVAVVGPSGSGKSSLVRAGLLPRIAERRVLVTEMFPGAFPFEELETALLRVAVDRPSGMIADLTADDRGLLRVVKQIVPDERHDVLLVIDQFEELFSLVRDGDTQRAFLDALATAVTDPRGQLRVVLTLRADFFDRPLDHARFGALLERGLVPIKAPTRDELASAVARPAVAVGVDLEPGLTAEIVSDVEGQPGGLPLLQYALTELFRTRTSNLLTVRDYRRIGGVVGALGTRAEELYADLGPVAQEAARQVFLRLVTVDDGTDDVRQRVRVGELATLAVDRHALDTVLDRFGGHRLLSYDRDPVTRGPTVEVAHEALLREWSRLRGWIAARRADLIVHRRFAAAVDEWERAERDRSYLPQGGRLEQFEDGVADSELTLTRPEREFLAASRARRAADREREARTARRLRRTLAAVTTLAVLAVVAGIVAWQQRARADEARFAAETRRLTADAPVVADTNRQVGLLLAAEAFRREPGPAALGALQRVLVRTDGFLGYVGEGHSYADVGWTPDGRLVGAHDDGLAVIDPATPHAATQIATPPVARLEVSPTEAVAAVLSTSASTAHLIELDTGAAHEVTLPTSSDLDAAPIVVAQFSPDGAQLAVGTSAGEVAVWDVASRGLLWRHLAHPETDIPYETNPHEPLRSGLGTTHLSFSPDGGTLATAGLINVRLWDLDDETRVGADVEVFRTAARGELVPVAPLAIELDDDQTVTVATAWGLSEWNGASGDLVRELPIPASVGSVGSSAIDFEAVLTDDGALLSSVGGTTLELRRPGESATELDVREYPAQVPGRARVAVDASGRRIAVAGDGRVSLWSRGCDQVIARGVPLRFGADGGEVTSDGRYAAMGSVDRQTGSIWDLTGDEPQLVADGVQAHVRPPDDRLWSIDISDTPVVVRQLDRRTFEPTGPEFRAPTAWYVHGPVDGWLAISGGTADPVVRIFDADTAALRHTLAVSDATAQEEVALDVSPDGRRLVAATTAGAAAVWDTTTWERIAVLSEGGGQIVKTAYTPDGRRMATLAADGTVTIRDATSFRRVGLPITTGNEAAVGDGRLEIGPDGRLLAIAGRGFAQLWDLEARVQIGSDFPADGASVDPEVRRMLTVWGDHAIVWDLDTDTWADAACTAAGRNLTRQEWAQFLPNDPYRATCDQWPGAEGGAADG